LDSKPGAAMGGERIGRKRKDGGRRGQRRGLVKLGKENGWSARAGGTLGRQLSFRKLGLTRRVLSMGNRRTKEYGEEKGADGGKESLALDGRIGRKKKKPRKKRHLNKTLRWEGNEVVNQNVSLCTTVIMLVMTVKKADSHFGDCGKKVAAKRKRFM